MFLTAHELSFLYEDSSISALNDINVTCSDGWTGIAGDNGAGKTTLLLLLCGMLKPTGGSITPMLKGTYCAQSTEIPPIDMEDFAFDYSNDALRLRNLLSIDDEWFWRYGSLSHGERKRIQIGCAIRLDPPLLALDEPTNHLDAETREIVLSALRYYRGIGLLVSHDRTLLDELVYQCLFLESGKATTIPGTYSDGKRQIELLHKTAESERRNAKDDLLRLQSESVRRSAVADRSATRRSAKGLDKHDSDARAKIRLAVYSGQDGKAGLLSAQMDKKIDTARKRLDKAWVEKKYDKPLELAVEPSKRKVLISRKAGFITLGEAKTLRYPDIFIGCTDRIGLQGSNGAGKSTFLTYLLAGSDNDEKILYLPQEMTEEEGKSVLEKMRHLPQSELGRILSIVARLNSPPERILSGKDLSPGELRKVMLACGLLKQPYLIIMDEPTNHLDIHSIEALQDVLGGCKCALLLVSHDEQFLDALTDIRWVFAPPQHSAEQSCMKQEPGRDCHPRSTGPCSAFPEDGAGYKVRSSRNQDSSIELRIVLR